MFSELGSSEKKEILFVWVLFLMLIYLFLLFIHVGNDWWISFVTIGRTGSQNHHIHKLLYRRGAQETPRITRHGLSRQENAALHPHADGPAGLGILVAFPVTVQ